MSDNQMNVDDELTIDMAWKSDLASVYNDPDGDTVSAPGDSHKGEITTEQRPDIDNWSELTDKQQEIISTAAAPNSNWESLADLSGSVEATQKWVRETLKNNTPELFEDIKDESKRTSQSETPTDKVKELLLNGHSSSEVADRFDTTTKTIRRHAKGEYGHKDSTLPELEYNGSKWVPAGQDTQDTQETFANDTDNSDTETVNTDSKDTRSTDDMITHKTDITTERIDEIRCQELTDDSRGPRREDDLTEEQFRYYLKTSDKRHNPSEPPLTYNRSEREWVRVTSSACVACEEFYEPHSWEFCPECGTRLMRWGGDER